VLSCDAYGDRVGGCGTSLDRGCVSSRCFGFQSFISSISSGVGGMDWDTSQTGACDSSECSTSGSWIFSTPPGKKLPGIVSRAQSCLCRDHLRSHPRSDIAYKPSRMNSAFVNVNESRAHTTKYKVSISHIECWLAEPIRTIDVSI
jgi:hypothetical protein